METYKLHGLHCQNCAERLLDRLSQLENGDQIQFDADHHTVEVPEGVNYQKLKLLLNAEKVLLEKVDPHTDHDHTDTHSHSHTHHHHDVSDFTKGGEAAKRMKLVFFLNLIFAIAEFFFGVLFNSAAILSDAVHDLGDALSVGLAWLFQAISTKEANERYTFGHRRFSLLGAWLTALFLIVGSVLVLLHSTPLLLNPEPVNSQGMFWLAIVAVGINAYAAWLLSAGSSANEKVLSLHLMEDLLGWIGVLIVSVVLQFQPWYFLDPLLSIGIAVFILSRSLPSFFSTSRVFLESVPPEVDLGQVEQKIHAIPQVHAVTHLHVWSIDGEENAFTVTLFVSTEAAEEIEIIREQVRRELIPYKVTHSTIEIVPDIEKLIQ